MTKKVDISKLKTFVFKALPRDSILREIILPEADEIDSSEFCVKADLWLKLARGKTRENSGGS